LGEHRQRSLPGSILRLTSVTRFPIQKYLKTQNRNWDRKRKRSIQFLKVVDQSLLKTFMKIVQSSLQSGKVLLLIIVWQCRPGPGLRQATRETLLATRAKLRMHQQPPRISTRQRRNDSHKLSPLLHHHSYHIHTRIEHFIISSTLSPWQQFPQQAVSRILVS
jgi:hypothetical protein